MHLGNQFVLLYYHLSEMLDIWVTNQWIDLMFRLGWINERKQLITRYLLLKRIRSANLHLVKFGVSKERVDAKEFVLLIKRCRHDTLRYLRAKRNACK